jgi:ABC-type antimicrobial peptide transport system permease subunit
MEKLFSVFRLGLKYQYRYRRRYGFLMAALVFSFAIVTVITSVKDSMYDNVYYTAQSHYAGDIVAIGYDTDSYGDYAHRLGQDEISAILNAAYGGAAAYSGAAAESGGITPEFTVLRTLYGSSGIVHFNGTAVLLKYLMGCDWDSEARLLDRMDFDEPLDSLDNESIILSVPVARQLGAKMGDSVIMEALTRRGQKNTGTFIVKGIVKDNSIFGYYKAYISRLSLNRLIAYEDGDCSSVGFFFDDPGIAELKRMQLQNILSGKLQTGPLVYNRDQMALERDRPWEGIRVFLYTLPVYLSEISGLLDAMNIMTYLLYAMMLIIISVSAAVTYRLILHERAREMGVMRVIGFDGASLQLVLWSEVLVIGFISLAAGFLLALILGWAISLVSFSWFPGFEIFLRNGRLMPLYRPAAALTNIAFICIVLFVMALFPAFKASHKNLPGLLSGEPL